MPEEKGPISIWLIVAIVVICCFTLGALAFGKVETALTVGSVAGVVLAGLVGMLKPLLEAKAEVKLEVQTAREDTRREIEVVKKLANGNAERTLKLTEESALAKGHKQGTDSVLAAVESTTMPRESRAEVNRKVQEEGSRTEIPAYKPDEVIKTITEAFTKDQKRDADVRDKLIDKLGEKKKDQ